MARPVRVGIVGLGFGAEFIPIYQAHPEAELVAICRRDRDALQATGREFGVARLYDRYEDMLQDADIDAVHINSPIPLHAKQAVDALNAGKHAACTVPMATSLEDIQHIVGAANASGRTYMMMETVVYSREFLYVSDLYRSGEMGRLQYVKGAHHQEMAGWPGYWEGLPPMYYATHAVSPCLCLPRAKAGSVCCLGSGRISPQLAAHYGSPYAVETAVIKLVDSDVVASVTRSLFETAREYIESFDAYGQKLSFESPQTAVQKPLLYRGEVAEEVDVPDFADRLPQTVRRFTTSSIYDGAETHRSFVQGSGHGGSHPHLVHEFVRAVADGRQAAIGPATAANWTAVGICAHESAIRGGAWVDVPAFE